MIRDPGRVTDGFASLERGVDSGKNPSLLPRNQAAWAENVTVRGGYLSPRPGWNRIALVSSAAATALAVGKFQGTEFFDDATSRKGLLMVQAEGSLFRLELTNAGAVVTDVTPSGGPNSGILPQAWMVQAENYFVVQDGQSLPIIFDGATTRRAGGDEVPIGSGPMAYGMLRLWVAMGNNYVAGDVAGGPTGVLKFTENDYLAEGGTFSLPMSAGGITAMRFTATPNTGLGQGELLLFTPRAVFSNTAPVDRDAWKNLTQPIQTITVINQGGQSQASTVLVNSDVFMRSTDGIRTVIQAVRNFTSNQWGNTPISSEMKRVLDKDTQFLLPFASAVEFDNRLVMTCQPVPLPNGCYHTGLVALDFDLVTGMGEKLPPAYDGLWTGRQIYRLVKGRFAGVERCLALCRSETDGFLRLVIVHAVGSGYTDTAPVVVLTGGGGTGAAASAVLKVVTVQIGDPGIGYVEGDVLDVDGGTFSIQARLVVTSVDPGTGEITGIAVLIPGSYTVLPVNFVTVTGGGGGGATFGLYWAVGSISVTALGSGYTSNPVVSFTGGGGGTGATAVAVVDYRMELWELTKEGKFDLNLDDDDAPVEERIEWFMESPSYGFNTDRSNPATLKRLETGDLWMDRVTGTVDFTMHYRPDQYPCWSPWYAWQICAEKCVEIDATGCVITSPEEQYRPRMVLPQPPELDEPVVAKSMRTGYEFSVRLAGTGFARVKLLRLHAKETVEPVANPVVAASEAECLRLTCDCD